MQAIVGFLAMSPISVISVESLTREWGVSKVKLYDLVEVMTRICLIRVIRRKKMASKVHLKGAKLFFYDQTTYYALDGNIANSRESFDVLSFAEHYT